MSSLDNQTSEAVSACLSPANNPRAKLGLTLFGSGNNGQTGFTSKKINFAPKTLERE